MIKPRIIRRVGWWWISYGPGIAALGPYTTLAQATYIAGHLGHWPGKAGKA